MELKTSNIESPATNSFKMKIETIQTPEPDQPFDLPFEIRETQKRISISKDGGSRLDAIFISVWMTGWTGGCIFLTLQSYVEPHPITIFLAVVFWMFWVVVACGLVWILFGIELIELTLHGIAYERRALIPLVQRFVSSNEMICFREFQSLDVDDEPFLHIELVTKGKPVRFLGGLKSDHQEWLVARLNSFCGLSNEASKA